MTLENTKNLKKQVAPFEKSTIKKSVWQLIKHNRAIYYFMVPCL